jgi:hypothetical protein
LLTLQRVHRLDFRCNLPQFALLFLLGLGLRMLDEALSGEFAVAWSAAGWLQEGFYTALLLAVAALLAHHLRQPHLLLALPCVLLAGAPTFELLGWGENALRETLAERFPEIGTITAGLMMLWLLLWLWRSVAVCLFPREPRFWLRVNGGAALLAGVLVVPASFIPAAQLLVPVVAQRQSGNGPTSDPLSEEALSAQMQLLVQALDALEDERPGQADLFFVGFSPFAGAEVFRRDLTMAREVVETRFDAGSHSIALLNNPATILEEPLATVSNLRLALNTVGEVMNPEEDILFLYLTSHGTQENELEVEFAPRRLHHLTPAALASALGEAGIKWRVIVVSACYSGGFIAPLQDEHTLIITASRADRSSFGCGDHDELTYFGRAFFDQALREERSFEGAFERAKKLVAERENAERLTPSEPQIFVGEAMREKLAAFERREPARRHGLMALHQAAPGAHRENPRCARPPHQGTRSTRGTPWCFLGDS